MSSLGHPALADVAARQVAVRLRQMNARRGYAACSVCSAWRRSYIMFTFMAGVMTTAARWVASAVVVKRSSAMPFAIFAMTFAVHGAMRNHVGLLREATLTWWIGGVGRVVEQAYGHRLVRKRTERRGSHGTRWYARS